MIRIKSIIYYIIINKLDYMEIIFMIKTIIILDYHDDDKESIICLY